MTCANEIRPFAIARSIVFSLVLVVAAAPAHAALRPGRPPLSTGDTPASMAPATAGPAEFSCGTYAGNQGEHAWRRAIDQRIQQEVARGKRVTAAFPLDYVYNDVWIVEDDGTLTFSGTNTFDTDTKTFLYTAAGGGVFNVTNPAFSYDSVLGTLISPGDDGAVLVNLPFSFPFAGGSWTQMYVSGNGMLSFGGLPNPAGFYDPADFYSATPKIVPYYMDLNPGAGGTVRVRSEATKYTVTYSSVPEYGLSKLNTFQVVLYPSGNFSITYNAITSTTQAGNGSEIYTGFNPGGGAPLEAISFSSGIPHTSGAGAGVYESYYSYVNPVVNEVALFQRFYQEFPDDFFQLVYFTNFSQTMAGFANELNIKNDVGGLNLGIFDSSAQYGSSGALVSRCDMNQLSAWNVDPTNRFFSKENNFLTIMGQESGHRWGAFVYIDTGGGPTDLLLGRSDAHWSYYGDLDHSSLEGGDWTLVSGNTYSCPTKVDYYSEVDEYLMGLRTPEEVTDTYYISSASNDQSTARSVGTPVQGATASGTYIPVTVENIVAANGARTPTEPAAQHDFRQGFILLVKAGTTPTQQQLDQIAGYRAAWEPYFEKSTDGRLACNTSITQTFAVAGLCGHVRDKLTSQIIPQFTAHSLERTFNQHVPDGGRYAFRYMANAGSGAFEHATIVFNATGYVPDTLKTDLTYGQNVCLDVHLLPVQTGTGDGPGFRTVLRGNVPNPFNPATTIGYELATPGPVRLLIFDAAGHRVRTLVEGTHSRGTHQVVFDGLDDAGRSLASGVYFYRLEAGGTVQTRKMVLVK